MESRGKGPLQLRSKGEGTNTNLNRALDIFEQLEVPKINLTNSFGLGIASNNVDLIEKIDRKSVV